MRIVTVGELTIDDVIVENETAIWKQVGGGALYSAVGAAVWGAHVVISASVGADYPESVLLQLQDRGLSTAGVTQTDGPSLGLWNLYETDGRRHEIVKQRSATFQMLDDARMSWREAERNPDGIHIAPQTTGGQLAAVRSAGDCVVTLDLLTESFVNVERYRDGSILNGVSAFLPSEQEVREVWGDRDPRELFQELKELCSLPMLVVKHGARGASIVSSSVAYHVPSVAERVIDPTGAGDAFCGGFLTGLVETGDPAEAAVRGAVSASFVVETRGAIAAIDASRAELIESRSGWVRARVQPI